MNSRLLSTNSKKSSMAILGARSSNETALKRADQPKRTGAKFQRNPYISLNRRQKQQQSKGSPKCVGAEYFSASSKTVNTGGDSSPGRLSSFSKQPNQLK